MMGGKPVPPDFAVCNICHATGWDYWTVQNTPVAFLRKYLTFLKINNKVEEIKWQKKT